MTHPYANAVLSQVEAATAELVEFARDLVRIPTVNPPGALYRECARVVRGRLEAWGHEVETFEASGHEEHTEAHPRVNVVGRLAGAGGRPLVHLNGHMDVVPPGDGWSVDPFAGVVRDGRLYGRGSADMKAGLAAAAMAVEAIRRAGAPRRGTIEVSATVDEESGGHAGVAHLARIGRLSSRRTDFVIIPEPFGPDRICIGHRGVLWLRVTARGRTAHGSMPFLGTSAVGAMAQLLERFRTDLEPALAERVTSMPVVPEGARHATLNVNAVMGGQAGEPLQSPCVPDECSAVLDRRFLPEESVDEVRAEIVALLDEVAAEDPDRAFDVEDLMVVHPTRTSPDSPLVVSLGRAVEAVRGGPAELVASPGTYDQKHVAGIAGVPHCVAYGPGELQQAHQPDESCSVDDMVAATQVLALTLLDLACT